MTETDSADAVLDACVLYSLSCSTNIDAAVFAAKARSVSMRTMFFPVSYLCMLVILSSKVAADQTVSSCAPPSTAVIQWRVVGGVQHDEIVLKTGGRTYKGADEKYMPDSGFSDIPYYSISPRNKWLYCNEKGGQDWSVCYLYKLEPSGSLVPLHIDGLRLDEAAWKFIEDKYHVKSNYMTTNNGVQIVYFDKWSGANALDMVCLVGDRTFKRVKQHVFILRFDIIKKSFRLLRRGEETFPGHPFGYHVDYLTPMTSPI